ncbi:hypothetical protein J14TS2_45230 [Bacillus sp. J14TS2]|uniref:hypothetical protein n=1 Tax=Bacillus sp. J14TS2 TaxID=2807188 RepID=UPI001B2BE05D|nr:hypothetical protein [Bacillus sp. J14TS2]GIN74048.1 hypothetical protein J14TS2_45230 [Bacillus sp. J14TS2]
MEEVNIIRITPEQIGYKDRGIMKWMGLMLSDHNEALKKEKVDSRLIEVEPKKEMTEEEISQVLYQAFINNIPVAIQANALKKDGNYYKDVECMVSGYTDNQIHLSLKNGRSTSCTIEQIRNVEKMDPIDWYNKRK